MESKQNILIRRFYRGDEWKIARAMKIAAVGGSLFQGYQKVGRCLFQGDQIVGEHLTQNYLKTKIAPTF